MSVTNVCRGGMFAFGAVLMCCGEARAQAAPTGADRFALVARARVSYESNVAGGDSTIAELRAVQPADTVYSVGTTVSFQLPSARRSFFATGSADFDRHQKNKNLDANNYAATLGAASQFGPCGGVASASYTHQQALIQDLAVPATSNTIEQESASVGLTCGRRGIVGGVNAGISKVMNNGKGLETGTNFIDSESRNVGASLGYQNNVLGNLSLTTQYSQIDYKNVPLDRLFSATGFDTSSVGVNYSRKIGNRLSGSAGVSYTRLSSQGVSLKSNSVGANVDMAYRASPRLGLALSYSLGNDAAVTADATYVRSETFRFSGDYRLNTRVSLQASVAKSQHDFRGVQTTFLQIRKSEDVTVSGGANVKIGRKISLTLDASHVDRSADLPQFNFKSNRVSLGITGRF